MPTLHGNLDDGTDVTLWAVGWHPIQHQPAVDGDGDDDRQQWKRTLSTAVLGANLQSVGSTLFSRSAVRFTNLDMWSRHPTIVDHDAPAPEHPQAQVTPYGEEYRVTIGIENPQVVRRQAAGYDSINQGSGDDAAITFDVVPAAPLAFHDHLAMDARNLLTFSYQAAAHITAQYATTGDGQPVRIYRQRPSRKSSRRVHRSNMIITANTSDPVEIFSRWWAATKDYYPLPQILAGRFYTRFAFLEHHVISAISALEATYDRLGHLTSAPMDNDLFHARKQWHIDNEPDEEFRRLLIGIGNRQSLRRKLKAIYRDLSEPLVKESGTDPKKWVEDVMEVRDLLAHTGSHVPGVSDSAESILARVDRDTRAVLALLLCRFLDMESATLSRAASVLSQSGPLVRADSMPGDM
ncbi:hypothetical protein BJ984_001733 [Herbiconiux flava]|uniref:Apea-like HEPN domain-containing protein n=1 Tax=Herbiconiux flava TaxID=881268 RepID=A0A852SP46_9MICO|nr:hypothetical protein [Herbiconiux flava]GLK17332.1 hypothetical protein GCM10017602_18140 [Herbiconiux flava]